jgi:fatty acid desaturase
MNDLANETTTPATAAAPDQTPAPDQATAAGPAEEPTTTKSARKRARRKTRRKVAKVLVYTGVLILGLLAIAEPWLLIPVALVVTGLVIA